MAEIVLCEQRKKLLKDKGHIIVKGGPGAGKTTISLIKAEQAIGIQSLEKAQRILFLSFARSTIGRVIESAKNILDPAHLKHIEINTYHAFAWTIIQSFSKLIIKSKVIRLLSPPDAAAKFFGLNKEDRRKECKRLFEEEGILSFEIFAEVTVEILERTKKVREMLSDAYPIIYVDEFQDTDPMEWRMIQLLGEKSIIIALADPYQRIYDFRGANPKRIKEFETHFKPNIYDFGDENNRSNGTDIVKFGNDLLSGANKGKRYNQVVINKYGYDAGEPMSAIKYCLFNSIKRQMKDKPDGNWSIAVLTKTRLGTLSISNYLTKSSARLKSINHEVLIDPAGPSLAAVLIAGLMEKKAKKDLLSDLVNNVVAHLRGRKDKITQVDLERSGVLTSYLNGEKIRGKNRLHLINDIETIVENTSKLTFSGIPQNDWLMVRDHIGNATHEVLVDIHADSKYIKLLNRGALLGETLAENYKQNGHYGNTREAVRTGLLQEHFSMANRDYRGIYIMTLHKSKGKEFDEVVIWDDRQSAIVPFNPTPTAIEQARYLLRVGVTRARQMTTICTPSAAPCILL